MTASTTTTTEAPTPVILWCVPRSVSTATERAFMTRQDTRSWHEPLGDPFYFSSKRQCFRYSEQEAKESGHWDKDIVQTMAELLDPVKASEGSDKKEPVKYIFIKDMAQYIIPNATLRRLHPGSRVYQTESETSHGPTPDEEVLENPTVIPTSLLRRFKHGFLIRTPEKAVPSYWKCCEEKMAGFEYFDGAEAGFEEVRLLYKYISNPKSTFHSDGDSSSSEGGSFPGAVQSQPLPPPLIDASVLLAQPSETIEHLCKSWSIPFDPNMLHWESGSQSVFDKWGNFHQAANASTGFRAEKKEAAPVAVPDTPASPGEAKGELKAPVPQEDKSKKTPAKEMPQEVKETIERNTEPYQWLYQRRTIK